MLAAMTERLEREVPMGEVDRYNVGGGICGRQSRPLAPPADRRRIKRSLPRSRARAAAGGEGRLMGRPLPAPARADLHPHWQTREGLLCRPTLSPTQVCNVR